MLPPGGHLAVAGVTAADVLRARRSGRHVRDTVAVVGPGTFTLVPLFREATDAAVARLAAGHGTAGLNVDVCRTPGPGWTFEHNAKTGRTGGGMMGVPMARVGTAQEHEGGRWPTNLVFTHHEGCGERLCQTTCPVAVLKHHIDQAVDKTDAPTTYAFPRLATFEDVLQWVRALVGIDEPPSADREFLAARSSYLDGRQAADSAKREADSRMADVHAWLDEVEVEGNARNHRVGRGS